MASAPPNFRATIDTLDGMKSDKIHKEEKNKSSLPSETQVDELKKEASKDSPKHPRASIDVGMLEGKLRVDFPCLICR